MKLLSITFIYLLTNQICSMSCPWGTEPVCGVDYVTYPNQCALAAAYVEMKYPGPCTRVIDATGKVQSNCPQTYLPVCGRDGVTYLNELLAYSGPCDNEHYQPHNPPLVCRCNGEQFAPICSLAGYTFENVCVLSCTQQIASAKGPCNTACDCPQLYRPVCGVDGLTYDNNCTAECVGIVKQSNGECPSILRGCQFCSKVFMPACGKDNVTYRNLCEMKCNNVDFENFGKCESKGQDFVRCDRCPDVLEPICGTDGRNYKNSCLCQCRGDCKKYSEGRCPQEKSCARCAGVLQPVCSKKGVTYDNRCYLDCAQDRFLKNGQCDFSLDQQVPESFADYSKLEEFFRQYQTQF